MRFDRIAERQIRKAQAEGRLDGLREAGEPLPPAGPGDFAEAAGFRIMAEAGALPLEVELRKALQAQARIIAATTGNDARKREMARFAELQERLAMQEEARRHFFRNR